MVKVVVTAFFGWLAADIAAAQKDTALVLCTVWLGVLIGLALGRDYVTMYCPACERTGRGRKVKP